MAEKYYVTIYCEAVDAYEVEAEEQNMNFLKLIALALLVFIALVLIVTFLWLAALIAAKLIEFVYDLLW